MKLKQLIPSGIKLNIRLIKRSVKDRKLSLRFAERKSSSIDFPFYISEIQPIKQSNYFQNKIDNIKLGANLIQEIIIEPGEIISFWKAVGRPSKKQGFKIGRNLINGKLTSDFGGGLCQLSGIMYITSLRGGLNIVERHNHTLDIYKEEERFTPLGADATVVYAYKDLRIGNPYPHPIRFKFIVDDNSIECRLMSMQKIEQKQIDFVRCNQQSGVTVETYIENWLFDTSYYIRHT